MSFEELKKEFIDFKKDYLKYIGGIYSKSRKQILSEKEKLDIYRTLTRYSEMDFNFFNKFRRIREVIRMKNEFKYSDTILEFEVENENDLPRIGSFSYNNNFNLVGNKYVLTVLGTGSNKSYFSSYDYDILLNKQKILERPIYIFRGEFDHAFDDGVYLAADPQIFAHYWIVDFSSSADDSCEIPIEEVPSFKRDNIILYPPKYVLGGELKNIFEEELLNEENTSVDDCINKTITRSEQLSYTRNPKTKEKLLLDKLSQLYEKVRGKSISSESLYNGDFLSIIKETYKLPNDRIVKKEKVVKNNGNNSVIVVAHEENDNFIITMQNRINDVMIAEFPSGYIEENESVLDAAKRELKEETGYSAEEFLNIDWAYSSPGIDNSITYLVYAYNCAKTDDISHDENVLVDYSLFSKEELKYLIKNNIMSGALNKLAYYKIVNNVEKFKVNQKNYS